MSFTAAEIVARSRTKLISRGGVRIPGGMLQPAAARALDALVQADYAPSRAAIVGAALVEVAARIKADRGKHKSARQ